MKISIAQTNPIKGDISANIESHKKLIGLAHSSGADLIFFPELSITGYEPELADDLSAYQNDKRLDEFQTISDTKKITICVGFPTKGNEGLFISLLIFQPNKPRQIYSKQHLHPGEEKFFTNGQEQVFIKTGNHTIAPAICYELSVTEHSSFAHQNGADIYIASVLNSVTGVDKDLNLLSQIAKKYGMITMMSNYTGTSGGYQCAGKSSIWNRKGELIAQFDDKCEGILMIDTENEEAMKQVLTNN